MGAPAFEYEQLFKQKKIQVFSSNYELYGDMSSRVMSTLATFSPELEVYSIDEAFLKFNGFDAHFNLESHALKMVQTVKRQTTIPISVGMAPTKALLFGFLKNSFVALYFAHPTNIKEAKIIIK